MPAGAGVGWILILVLIGVVVLIVFMRRRVPVDGDPDDEETEELEVLYQRCRKNLDHLAVTYVDAQTWLERLDGKIPAAQWKDWNDKFTRISVDDFTKQLKEILTTEQFGKWQKMQEERKSHMGGEKKKTDQ